MKKKYKRVVATFLVIIICLSCLSFFNTSKAAQINDTLTFQNKPSASEIVSLYKKKGLNVTSATINSCVKEYRYSYTVETTGYVEVEEKIPRTPMKELKDEMRVAREKAEKITKEGKYNGYKVKSAVWTSNFEVKVIYYKPKKYTTNRVSEWTTSSFNSIATSSSKPKLKVTETRYKCSFTVYTSDSNPSVTPSQGEKSNPSTNPTDKPSQEPSNNQDKGGVVVDNQNDKKQTETLDNGTALKNAIDFVNQVFDIKEANKNNQAVKDLVNKTKTATDIVASELTNLNSYNTLSISEFTKQAYKRALGREATDEEVSNVEEDKLTFSDVISTVVGSDEFKEVCKKYELEVGSYTPVKFNQNTTQEKAALFVKSEFSIIMGREPSDTELNVIVDNLVNGKITASVVIASIFEASEFKNKGLDDAQFANVLARATIGRDLTDKEKSGYVERLSTGFTRNELIQELLRHSAFVSLCESYGLSTGSYSPKDIVPTTEAADKFNTKVSKSILGENANVIQTLSGYLTSGKYSAGDFVKLYVESTNFADRIQKENMTDNDYVKALFQATVQRDPTSEELSEYLNDIKQNDKSAILTKLLNLNEFASVCNRYYLPVRSYSPSSSNAPKSETLEAKAGGATIIKIKNTDTTGKITETVQSVKFDTSTGIKGDVNGDEAVNASDASLVLMYAAVMGVNFVQPTQEELNCADINGDGAINASDAALILIYAANYGATGSTDWNEVLNR
ncbi:MAG: DUF4214 domain-containing protein [Clostridia bacterium]|nr:DUF4214 domain-containing protein [Clostridia bacterium]